MKVDKFAIAATLFVSTFGAAQAQTEDVKFTVGLKSWNHSYSDKASGADNWNNTSSFNANSPLVTLTAKKGDYFVTYSSLMTTVYALQSNDLKRSDTDIAAGWSFKPGYSVLLGYKKASVEDNKSDGIWNNPTSTIKGAFVGLTGAQILNERWFAYESIVHAPTIKNSSLPSAKINFTTFEAGFGYAIDARTQVTLGYRMQNYDRSGSVNQKIKLDGIIFGGSVNF